MYNINLRDRLTIILTLTIIIGIFTFLAGGFFYFYNYYIKIMDFVKFYIGFIIGLICFNITDYVIFYFRFKYKK